MDKVFLTVLVPSLTEESIDLRDEGEVHVRARSQHDGQTYTLDLALYGKIDAARSKWFTHRDRIELTLWKAETQVRWFQLLKGTTQHPQMSVDWAKYKDYDEELDEIEIKTGKRGVPVPRYDRELTRAVEDYWQRKRIEDRQKGDMPNLDEVTKEAEKEWERLGRKGSYQDIVQRKWKEMQELRKRERELEAAEDEWAGWTEPAAAANAPKDET